MMKFGQIEHNFLQQACTKINIQKYLSARRETIPDGALEMQQETKNNESGNYVDKSKRLSTA